MEVDNVHAQIERKKTEVDIFDPSGFYATVRLANKINPYKVLEMD